ncbi:predicted protein [Nematostella vectensis]|uniref:UspA domain-containing protein n=1 Tax=Nematostella vectensis TaxID=45351 RepID=A7RI05_NEMVE|nr:predicted protein [Nematostella vectensis]|eukprot:XP_001641129.1 predicted protein [Nematostella vectensis]
MPAFFAQNLATRFLLTVVLTRNSVKDIFSSVRDIEVVLFVERFVFTVVLTCNRVTDIFSSRHHDAYRAIIHDVNEKANALKDSYISKLKALVQDEGGFEVFVRGEVDGGVGHTLCKEAFDHDISLIVMSRRGIGLIRRTLMGSVSDYVLHHAHVPIIIVPPCNCQVAKTALQQKTEEAQECQQTEEIS